MGRQPANVEFIRILKELSGHKTVQAFADACDKEQPNVSNYLNARSTPGKKVLKDCIENLFGWQASRIMEISPLPQPSRIPEKPGLYVLYDSGGNVLYIGKAKNLKTEIYQTLRRKIPKPIRAGPRLAKARPALSLLVRYVSMYHIPSRSLRHNLEGFLLRVFANQTHNSNIGHFPGSS